MAATVKQTYNSTFLPFFLMEYVEEIDGSRLGSGPLGVIEHSKQQPRKQER